MWSRFAQNSTAARERVTAIRALLESLEPSSRETASFPYDHLDRKRWSRTPGERSGVPLSAMNPEQLLALHRALRSVLSERGYLRANAIMLGEEVAAREEIELEGLTELDPSRYWFALYGSPGSGRWGWRLEGHHLSLRFFFVGDHISSVTPAAWGAYPTPFSSGSRAGFSVFAEESDHSRQLIKALVSVGSSGFLVQVPRELLSEVDTFKLPTTGMDVHESAREQLFSLESTVRSDYHEDIVQALFPPIDTSIVQFAWFGTAKDKSDLYWHLTRGSMFLERSFFIDPYGSGVDGHVHRVCRDVINDFGGR